MIGLGSYPNGQLISELPCTAQFMGYPVTGCTGRGVIPCFWVSYVHTIPRTQPSSLFAVQFSQRKLFIILAEKINAEIAPCSTAPRNVKTEIWTATGCNAAVATCTHHHCGLRSGRKKTDLPSSHRQLTISIEARSIASGAAPLRTTARTCPETNGRL